MIESEFKLGTPDWLWPAIAILTVALLIVIYGYRHRRLPVWIKIVNVTLKMVAIAALAFCLLQPMRQGQRPRPQANLLPILVDDSESMLVGFPDRPAAADALSGLLSSEQDWRVRMAQDFAIRPYAFAGNLRSVDDLSALPYTGTASALGASLETLTTRFRNRPMAGVLLFSDGNVTQREDLRRDWRALGVPIYPVVLTRPPVQDLRIGSATVSQSDFEAAPVTVDVRLAANQLEGQKSIVEIIDAEGQRVDQQTVDAPANGKTADLRFRFRPERSGVQFFTIAAYLQSEYESFAEGTTATEATLENNWHVITVDRPKGPFRILYVAGRPNWEFKFMRRSLAEDAEIELTGLLRIAKRQPKFSFRDSRVPPTNPLFAGLGKEEEEAAEEHDEPVILRLGVDEAEDLKTGFPSEPEELFAYDAVILDDIEADFFSTDQQLLLRRFVSVRGGGVMMLGGHETFSEGGYDQTPIGEMLPVYLHSTRTQTSEATTESNFHFDLTREGMLQPWLRLRANQNEERQRLRQAVPLRVLNRASDAKPGAEVLATVTDTQDPDAVFPAVVTQRFGNGRASAVLVGDLWRWVMRPVADGTSSGDTEASGDPAQAWRQWVRWLISDVPQRIDVNVRDADVGSGAQTIEVMVRDEVFLPLDNASVELTVTDPEGEEVTLNAAQDKQQAGLYRVNYWSPLSGGFLVRANVRREDGSPVGEVEAGWSADRKAAEFQQLQINQDLLQTLADETGGRLLSQSELNSFAKQLSSQKMPVMETWTYPVWHRPWMLLLAVACLCTEWGLRRWKGWP
ncbi:hypothetical protein [Roseimaritima ulvae]|uniref:Glutamine amidotransferase domain-containing protein n=1 Tax=Roseimaritima ulvae TaxID=980254 RepID=A0A5B9QQY7_9BACT|nr:hypothetical protein [Roseimaritima ulvae]QEG41438.1 hypothetical protein UC8_34590 [Roseimaritima ulvae]